MSGQSGDNSSGKKSGFQWSTASAPAVPTTASDTFGAQKKVLKFPPSTVFDEKRKEKTERARALDDPQQVITMLRERAQGVVLGYEACVECEPFLATLSETPDLSVALDCLQALSDQALRWFFVAGGYKVLLLLIKTAGILINMRTITQREALARACANEDAAELVWRAVCSSLCDERTPTIGAPALLGDAVVLGVVQADIAYLVANSGLCPDALAALARTQPRLAGYLLEILTPMRDAYEDPVCLHDILVAIASTITTLLASSKGSAKLNGVTNGLSLKWIYEHAENYPTLWTGEEDATTLAGLVAVVLKFQPTHTDLAGRLLLMSLRRPDGFGLALAHHFLTHPEGLSLLLNTIKGTVLSEQVHNATFIDAINLLFVAAIILLGGEAKTKLVARANLLTCAHIVAADGDMHPLFNTFLNLVAVQNGGVASGARALPTASLVDLASVVEAQVAPLAKPFRPVINLLTGKTYPLTVAVSNNDVLMAAVLVDMGFSCVGQTGWISEDLPFLNAVKMNRWSIVRLFLEHTDPNALNVPLTQRHRNGDRSYPSQITLLMALLRNPDTPLDLIQFIIDRGANVNARTVTSEFRVANVLWVPLHYAAEHSVEAVSMLLKHGADLFSTDSTAVALACLIYESPLYVACAAGKVDIAAVLLEHGALATPKGNGRAPMLAVAYAPHHQIELVSLLEKHGASIHVLSREQPGPPTSLMHAAITTGNITLVRCLLDRGVSFRTGCRQLQLKPDSELERNPRHGELVRLLLAHGWVPDMPMFFRWKAPIRTQRTVHNPSTDWIKCLPMLLGYLYLLLTPSELSPPAVAHAMRALFPPTSRDLAELKSEIEHAEVLQILQMPPHAQERLARVINAGLALAAAHRLKHRDAPRSSVVECPQVTFYLPRHLIPHRDTPLAFRCAVRALALLRLVSDRGMTEYAGNSIAPEIERGGLCRVWADLPLEIFEAVLDELFQLERDARALL